jgi:hypothetical protein
MSVLIFPSPFARQHRRRFALSLAAEPVHEFVLVLLLEVHERHVAQLEVDQVVHHVHFDGAYIGHARAKALLSATAAAAAAAAAGWRCQQVRENAQEV